MPTGASIYAKLLVTGKIKERMTLKYHERKRAEIHCEKSRNTYGEFKKNNTKKTRLYLISSL